MKTISLDTETTGVDFYHGAAPFFVTICDGTDTHCWEWEVNPKTREVYTDTKDLEEIWNLIQAADRIVLQNAKFDVKALAFAGLELDDDGWPWEKTEDTLIAGHCLYSNRPHDLTSMAIQYLGIDITRFETELEEACNEARRYCRTHHPEYMLAKDGLPCMPSAKEKCWKFDTWLPRLVDPERWENVLSTYANADSQVTLALFQKMEKQLHQEGLWEIYRETMKVIPVAYKMEMERVTLSSKRLFKIKNQYEKESAEAERTCKLIANEHGIDLSLPKSGNNKSLTSFIFDTLNLPYIKTSKKTGNPSLDKSVLEYYEHTLSEGTDAQRFIKELRGKRSRDTAISYLESYQRFWIGIGDTKALFPSLNPTGTDTLRWSSNNPNGQNISKKDGFNLRYAFGPAKGRHWYSIDAQNIELRIPAYEAEETEMIQLFERPNDPPYFGSNHLLVCHILYPKEFEQCVKEKVSFKDKYKANLYQWVKNGNFAVQYGALEKSGTADRAYHLQGAQRLIESRFVNIKKLNLKMIAFANKYGYVETIPDKTVNPRYGYRLYCSRSMWGGISPTIPLNYHVQGTACWWMRKAMVRCQEQLDQWRKEEGFYGRIVLQVHDELVFDMPVNTPPEKINRLMQLMEQSGDDIGIPTPVSCELHVNNWAEGTKYANH